MHFCEKIKILKTKLFLPRLLLPAARLPTYIIAYSSQSSTRNESYLTPKMGVG